MGCGVGDPPNANKVLKKKKKIIGNNIFFTNERTAKERKF
jgi:hypothetical protein